MISIIYSDEFLDHDTGSFHPEKPARLTAIVSALREIPRADRLRWHKPTPIEIRDEVITFIERVHDRDYIDRLRRIAARGGGMLDADTPVSPKSYEVALLAVAAWFDGVDLALSGPDPAFVLARPPGHHATSNRGMGFCLFSNAALAAFYALEDKRVKKVAIIDWDVHHGNGTQDIVENDPRIAYCSLHEYPNYPGTGRATETGGHGNVLNIPLPSGSALSDYQTAFEAKILPFLRDFQPDLLIVSAGYDANEADPLAGISLQPSDYGVFAKYLQTLDRPIVFGLEGGYDLDALAGSVVATLEAFIE
ncbi:histone deacetylase [Pannus brasiliensis CCIBt3594]|uniref:Histone deacetylase n=1 Tax=Pannus brasiliensis CCIBt3594 TaxID=1427578 RepID=A0AAW9QF15_9CHRO